MNSPINKLQSTNIKWVSEGQFDQNVLVQKHVGLLNIGIVKKEVPSEQK